jgi:uncharacterized protein YjeT (DUF2065 family)
MGILKHLVLPTVSLFHLVGAKVCLIDEGLVVLGAPALGRDMEKEPQSPSERHLTRIIGGSSLALLVNNVCAIVAENAHYRGMACLLEVIYFAVESYSLIKDGRKDGRPAFAMLGLSLLGLGIHTMEPGIFTKDKYAK